MMSCSSGGQFCNNVILGLEVQHMLTAKTKEKAGELLDLYGLGNFKKFPTF